MLIKYPLTLVLLLVIAGSSANAYAKDQVTIQLCARNASDIPGGFYVSKSIAFWPQCRWQEEFVTAVKIEESTKGMDMCDMFLSGVPRGFYRVREIRSENSGCGCSQKGKSGNQTPSCVSKKGFPRLEVKRIP